MKVRPKDEIIKCLIDILQIVHDKEHEINDYNNNEGWIECLKWVLQLDDKEVFTEGKNTLVVKKRAEK